MPECAPMILQRYPPNDLSNRSASKFLLASKETKLNLIPLKSAFYQMTKEPCQMAGSRWNYPNGSSSRFEQYVHPWIWGPINTCLPHSFNIPFSCLLSLAASSQLLSTAYLLSSSHLLCLYTGTFFVQIFSKMLISVHTLQRGAPRPACVQAFPLPCLSSVLTLRAAWVQAHSLLRALCYFPPKPNIGCVTAGKHLFLFTPITPVLSTCPA